MVLSVSLSLLPLENSISKIEYAIPDFFTLFKIVGLLQSTAVLSPEGCVIFASLDSTLFFATIKP